MVVKRGAQIVPVRRSILPNGQSCKWTPCKHYPNCFDGDMCERAHGDKELDYWKGKLGIVCIGSTIRMLLSLHMKYIPMKHFVGMHHKINLTVNKKCSKGLRSYVRTF